MLLNPKTPIVIGILLIVALVGVMTTYSPMPGDLSEAHAQVAHMADLETCGSCHHADGLAQGCLSCHEEIAAQLEAGGGLHHHLLLGKEVECASCHSEHNGKQFPLVSQISWGAQVPRAFKHTHMEFNLVGRHERLQCEECHEDKLPEPFALTLDDFSSFPRQHTFLGLTQNCTACHEDRHTEDLSGECDSCHGQETFRPTTVFNHGDHFSLEGGHERVECSRCHIIPPAQTPKQPLPFPFHEVRGTRCEECHDSPHRAAFSQDCETCHLEPEPLWSGAIKTMTAEKHEVVGFSLSEPHQNASCDGCHPRDLSFDERYPDPSAPEYARKPDNCEGCHEDVHHGQFDGKYTRCLDCHDTMRFRPTNFGLDDHANVYALTGAHVAVACTGCHLMDAKTHSRKFVGTTDECKVCHQDPHGNQFSDEIVAGDCTTCHKDNAESFLIRPFDHDARTGYPLEGAHGKASCNDCHKEVLGLQEGRTGLVRQYRNTPRECSTCHKDYHRGQFQEDGRTLCSGCHTTAANWKEIGFDHNTQSRFPLDGAHARLECARCHMPIKLDDGTQLVQYKPMGRECRDCHEIVPYSSEGVR